MPPRPSSPWTRYPGTVGQQRSVGDRWIDRDGVNRQFDGLFFVRLRSKNLDLEYGVAGGDLVPVRNLGRLDAGAVE